MTRFEYHHDPHAPQATIVAPSVFAVVRDDAGRVLLVRRTDNGLWELPGGRVEVGESATDAVEREVAEESGVVIKVLRLAGISTDPSHLIASPTGTETRQQFAVCVHAWPVSGDPHPDGSETSDAAWVPVGDLADREMHPTMRLRLAHALTHPRDAYLE
ncbi:NUDIX domain-containing protein [Actinomycetospora endophytica]|uniref:NUDIX domain-containing protein n=1 Tax=Actinomycetospora endophytica TaxID=2291215 RepID=A0ABS8PAR5_9PSEU|nr:NUDIX domain-containing protein [Actinomycetospora endophytica]MCD2195229.1 NUDIX domain-containing protein [Actinomycetospora endophytica]